MLAQPNARRQVYARRGPHVPDISEREAAVLALLQAHANGPRRGRAAEDEASVDVRDGFRFRAGQQHRIIESLHATVNGYLSGAMPEAEFERRCDALKAAADRYYNQVNTLEVPEDQPVIEAITVILGHCYAGFSDLMIQIFHAALQNNEVELSACVREAEQIADIIYQYQLALSGMVGQAG